MTSSVGVVTSRRLVDKRRHSEHSSGQDNTLRRTSRHVNRTNHHVAPCPVSVCVRVSRCVTVYVCGCVCRRSVEATAAQVVGNDDVSDGIKDKLNVGGVCGACLMTVDLFRCALVLCLELRLDVRCRLLVCLRACYTRTRIKTCRIILN